MKKSDPIPACWGVVEYFESSTYPWVKKRPRRQETEPLDRPFIASLLRNGIRIERTS